MTTVYIHSKDIKEISSNIQCDQFIVIKGRIGSRKTTLLRELLGLIPCQSGNIDWNDQKLDDPATQ